jgi:hypothetical protein
MARYMKCKEKEERNTNSEVGKTPHMQCMIDFSVWKFKVGKTPLVQCMIDFSVKIQSWEDSSCAMYDRFSV